MKNFILLLTLILTSFQSLMAQPSERIISRDQYINLWKEEAVGQMVKYKIPASITLAQGILESANGNSALAKYGNNHFGIKCHGWTGETINKDDDKKNECFRKYNDAQESFEDHSLFLAKRDRYSFLFNLEITDYKAWAKGLKKAGYATNPKYPELLINLIEKHKLYEYDTQMEYASSKNPTMVSSNMGENIPYTNLAEPSIAVNIHQVNKHDNGIKYINVKNGDTYYKIAKEFDLGLWQIYKYNDISKKDYLTAGQVIYLQPKKNRNKKVQFHVIKENESMRDISQYFGVKLKKLYKINELAFGLNPPEGTKLRLK